MAIAQQEIVLREEAQGLQKPAVLRADIWCKELCQQAWALRLLLLRQHLAPPAAACKAPCISYLCCAWGQWMLAPC